MAPTPNPGTTIFIGALLAWGIYRRVRRNIGRQPLRPVRMIISLVILSLVSMLMFSLLLEHTAALLGLGGGIVLGVGLGLVGLKLTKFETNDQGHFYTPNTHIGLALSVLFIGRVLYRQWALHNGTVAASQPQLFQSPLTLFILGLNLGYGFAYYTGLLIHTHDKK